MNIETYLHKRNVVQSGYDAIFSSEEINELEKQVPNVRSLTNPNRVGILDEWIAWVKEGYAGDNPRILAANKKSDEFCFAK
jgi:hypothetical protein